MSFLYTAGNKLVEDAHSREFNLPVGGVTSTWPSACADEPLSILILAVQPTQLFICSTPPQRIDFRPSLLMPMTRSHIKMDTKSLPPPQRTVMVTTYSASCCCGPSCSQIRSTACLARVLLSLYFFHCLF